MAKQSISVTLESATIENLKRLAAVEYRNISNMIDYIVAQYVHQLQEPTAAKQARAVAFAQTVKVTPYTETQGELKRNIHLDDADFAYLNRK